MAYDVLSDPQERAWYDSHEAQFLNRDSDGEFDTQQSRNLQFSCGNDVLQIMRNFNGAVAFTDEPIGFYGFLRNAFASIAKEEIDVVRGQARDVKLDFPSFGYEFDSYENTVKQFYAVWSRFSTRKMFAWKDLYRNTDAPDRRLRRVTEKENKRLREEGIHEFNDAVRSLVAFVRKRDPRYIPSKQTEAERQNALRDLAAAQAARSRAVNEARLRDQVLPEWAVAREPEEQTEPEGSISEEEQFECVACSKIFKREKQFYVHESSKKHQKAVYTLKKRMEREDDKFHLHADEKEHSTRHSRSRNVNQPCDDLLADSTDFSDSDDENEPVIESHIARLTVPTTPPAELKTSEIDITEAIEKDSEPEERLIDNTKQFRKSESAECDGSVVSSVVPEPKLGKAAQKRAKRAAQQATMNSSDPKHTCGTCGSTFPSRTRMFQHISDNKHEMLVFNSKTGAKEKRKKR